MKENELNDLFKLVFKREVDQIKMNILIKTFGEEKIISVLEYFVICGVKPPGEGKRDNPYGLLYKCCEDR